MQRMKGFLDVLPRIEADERNSVSLDEQMTEGGKLEEISNIFSKGSHQRMMIE